MMPTLLLNPQGLLPNVDSQRVSQFGFNTQRLQKVFNKFPTLGGERSP